MSVSDSLPDGRSGDVDPGDSAKLPEAPLSAAELMRILPHRPPFFFLRALLEWHPGRRALSEVEFDGSEEFFRGHFPGRPIVPGVILIEAAAQTAGLALGASVVDAPRNGRLPALAKVRAFRFRSPVLPRERLEIDAVGSGRFGDTGLVDVKVFRDSKVVADGELLLALSS